MSGFSINDLKKRIKDSNEISYNDYLDSQEFTKDEFIEEAMKILKLMDSFYSEAHKPKLDEDGEELCTCSRCNGWGHVVEGGDSIDCPSCDGSGEGSVEIEFDFEEFTEGIEHGIMFGDTKYLELTKLFDL